MGRTGQPVIILGAAALVVAAVGTSVALTRDEVPIAAAPTSLGAVHDAVVVSATGTTTKAQDGDRVPSGAVVRTGPAGSVELVTRGRVVYLGHSAAVAIVDGAHQDLRAGTAVFDAQHGDGLRVDIAGDQLTVPSGSATEAQRSVFVRVGALAGPAQITSSSARQVTVRPLTQATLNGDALAASTTPLHLSDSAAESHAVPDLVDADRSLKTLARGINASGSGEAGVITAAWNGHVAALPGGTARSEAVLPIVIADATSLAGTNAEQRYQSVIDWRRAGGSWGVVLAYLSGTPGHVEDTLTSLQHGQPNGQIGQVSLQALALPKAPNANNGNGNGPHSHQTPTPSPSSSGPGGSTPPPTGTPTPTPSKGAVHKLVGVVGGTVGGVLGTVEKLLHGGKAGASPSPKPTSGGLLGGLLGHK